MEVLVYDPYVELPRQEGVEQLSGLGELLAGSDFVSLHARGTRETENLLNAETLGAMRAGSFLINTARETLVDEQALDSLLASGHLAGAALDVVRDDGSPGAHPLLRHANVVITPHIGGATYDTLRRGAAMIADEIDRFATGAPLVNVIPAVPVNA
jgi:D-3-phosphoglycerate dehydrogenase